MEWTKNEFSVSTDPARLDMIYLHQFLSTTYWAKGIPLEIVQKAIAGSVCFGMYHGQRQIGFARVITDKATFGYLADVFIDPAYRRKGLSKWMMECVMSHPELQGFRRFMLATRDAHGLYRKFGFTGVPNPEIMMQIHNPDVYR
jgi:GNAT superfamily N-acetyltransferase